MSQIYFELGSIFKKSMFEFSRFYCTVYRWICGRKFSFMGLLTYKIFNLGWYIIRYMVGKLVLQGHMN